MDREANRRILDRAAAEALKFRNGIAERSHSPVKKYAEMAGMFAGPLPEHPADGEDVMKELVAKADMRLMMPTGPRLN